MHVPECVDIAGWSWNRRVFSNLISKRIIVSLKSIHPYTRHLIVIYPLL